MFLLYLLCETLISFSLVLLQRIFAAKASKCGLALCCCFCSKCCNMQLSCKIVARTSRGKKEVVRHREHICPFIFKHVCAIKQSLTVERCPDSWENKRKRRIERVGNGSGFGKVTIATVRAGWSWSQVGGLLSQASRTVGARRANLGTAFTKQGRPRWLGEL